MIPTCEQLVQNKGLIKMSIRKKRGVKKSFLVALVAIGVYLSLKICGLDISPAEELVVVGIPSALTFAVSAAIV